MFGDNEEQLKDECNQALDMYTLDDILELNDLTELEVLKYLVESGMVDLESILDDRLES